MFTEQALYGRGTIFLTVQNFYGLSNYSKISRFFMWKTFFFHSQQCLETKHQVHRKIRIERKAIHFHLVVSVQISMKIVKPHQFACLFAIFSICVGTYIFPQKYSTFQNEKTTDSRNKFCSYKLTIFSVLIQQNIFNQTLHGFVFCQKRFFVAYKCNYKFPSLSFFFFFIGGRIFVI